MCKTPACECPKAAQNHFPMDGVAGSDVSDDENEPMDSDDTHFSETSSDEGASDSDAESASGNRITTDMVVWLMLKEKGIISEEKYAEKAEECVDNIKFLIPKLPRSDAGSSESSDEDTETDNNGVSVLDQIFQVMLKEAKSSERPNGNVSDSQKSETLIVEKNGECDLAKQNENISGENEATETSNDEVIVTPTLPDEHEQAQVKNYGNNSEEKVKEFIRQQETFKDVNQITETMSKSQKEATDCGTSTEIKDVNEITETMSKSQKEATDCGTSTEIKDVNEITETMSKSQKEATDCGTSTEIKDVNETTETMSKSQKEATDCGTSTDIKDVNEITETMSKSQKEATDCGTSTEIKDVNQITETMSENQKEAIDCGTSTEKIEISLNKSEIKQEESNEKITNNNSQNDTNHATKTKEESKSVDLKFKNKPNRTETKKTKSFNYILQHIVKEKKISEDYEYVDVLETYVKDLDEHYKNNKAVDIFDKPTSDLKEFALFLNFYSPSSYKYIVKTFNTPLPEHKVLCSWYLKDDSRPGLTERAFKILKQKASGKRLTCALMSRDIFMRNYGLNYDQVDYGGGCNFEYTDKAVMTFVFVLVSLDEDWKIPIGYIFAKDLPAETHAELIRICLTQCYEAGADVVAVTLETPTPAEFLGCSFQDPKKLKTIFKHPACDRDVAVWIDPCLALRSARHTLKVKCVLQDDQGNKIRWNLIRKLKNLYSDETIKFQQPKFLQLRNHIAKVGLTTEIFSNSLSPALELCEELMPESFKDTAATRRYIEIVNTLYDILHSRITKDLGEVTEHINMAKDYMLALFCNQENALSPFDRENLAPDERLQFRSFVDGKPACGFIAFLICIESFRHLYTTLVDEEQRMDNLNTHRLCKDHAEDFVKNLRAYDGSRPDDFNGWAFQCYYDELFDMLERNPSFSDKNVKLEHWPLKNKYTPAVTIKLTSGKRAYDEVYSFQYGPKKLPKTSHDDRAKKLVRAYSKAMDTEADLATRKNMVGYLAGWIAAKFAKCLKCEGCIDALCSDKKLWFHKFITLKDINGVCLPSEEVFRICWECERALRTKGSPSRLRAWVLRRLAARFPWSSHVAKHAPGHHILLARAVIAKYIPLRAAAPFSSKERKRIVNMFKLFSCMTRAGLFGKLFGAANGDEED